MTMLNRDFAIGDLVELVQPYRGEPAGTRGGICDNDEKEYVIVELMDKPLDDPNLERILCAPREVLRHLDPAVLETEPWGCRTAAAES